MNTEQLKCAISCDQNMKETIIGVYASNTIPTTLSSLPFGLIVNTDPKHRTGRHWVAFFVEEKDTVECYDSHGSSPADYSIHLKLFMKRFKHVIVNGKPIQSNQTNVCGQHVLFVLMCRVRGYTMRDITDQFTLNFLSNDEFVYNIL